MVRFIKTQKPKKGIWNLERVTCISKYFATYVIKFKMKDTPENDIRFKIYMLDEGVIKTKIYFPLHKLMDQTNWRICMA